MPTLIDEDDARLRLRGLPGWQLADQGIVKEFSFAGFPEAVAFVSRLVAPSEAADHHPDLEIHYRRVIVRYSTHSASGLTEMDFAGARISDDAAHEV